MEHNKSTDILTNTKHKHTPSKTLIRDNISLLSWNIQSAHSVEGNKFDIEGFQNIIQKHDIICLQEIRRDIHLQGYFPICKTQTGNRSGGVGILIKHELLEGISEITKSKDSFDYIFCKLNKDFFKLTEDI